MEMVEKEQFELEQQVKEFFEILNREQSEEVAIVTAVEVQKQHRTLQQDFFRVILTVMELYGQVAETDLRNEGAVRVCRRIGALLEEGELYLPRI
jgi:hypothetical protein